MFKTFWGYLNGHKSPNRINVRDIITTFPDTAVGGSATVCRALLKTKDGTSKPVALKKFKYSIEGKAGERSIKYFSKELRNAAKLSHKNIVKIEGFYIENTKPVIVSTWAGGGTMNKYVKENPKCDLRKIAAGIASGLEHLHRNGIVHADLKGMNILMSNDGVPMLSDFGQARAIEYTFPEFVTSDYIRQKGTTNWIAPEIARYINESGKANKIICTEKSDMWSYGMVIYELITGKIPYADNTRNPRHIEDSRIRKKIEKGNLPAVPNVSDERKRLWRDICIPCCILDKTKRLTAKQVIAVLSKMDKGR